jgi:hypothetical protein
VSAICLLSLCVFGLVPKAFGATYKEAADRIAEADLGLRGAFGTVADAEQHGANVSVLAQQLNQAGAFLARAREYLTVGNYSGAISFADDCESLAGGVGSDAVALRSDAVAAAVNWWIPIVFSVSGSVVVVVVLFFVWRWFKQGFLKRILKNRPEVTG